MKKIVSFGFKNGAPLDSTGAVIDVRKIMTRNPFHDKTLRKLRGTDLAVQADLQKTPNWSDIVMQLIESVKNCSLAGYDVIYLGCTGGHHRSVYAAILMGNFFNVPVEHRDINL